MHTKSKRLLIVCSPFLFFITTENVIRIFRRRTELFLKFHVKYFLLMTEPFVWHLSLVCSSFFANQRYLTDLGCNLSLLWNVFKFADDSSDQQQHYL